MTASHRAAIAAGLTALALAWAGPASASPVDRWSALVHEASARFGIPVAWIERVMAAESGGRTTMGGRPVRSSAGAMGLMQLMPRTWAEMRARHGLGPDPDEPRDNVLAGTAYLRLMYDRFGYPGLFAAYNAGPARFADHLATGRRLPAETVAYVAKVAARRMDKAAPGVLPTPILISSAPPTPDTGLPRVAAASSGAVPPTGEALPGPPALFVVHRPMAPPSPEDARSGVSPEPTPAESGRLFVRLGPTLAIR